MEPDTRKRNIDDFAKCINACGVRMSDAIADIKMESLSKGDESLGLVAGFVIDLAFGPLGKYAGKALASVVGSAGESIGKSAADAGKKLTQGHAKSEAGEKPKATANTKTSMLDLLRGQVEKASFHIQRYGANNLNDDQLLQHIQTYQPRATDEYKKDLQSFLERLQKSDVWNIGRNDAVADTFREGGFQVTRDVRCVWLVNPVLGTRALYFEKHDGDCAEQTPWIDHQRPDRAEFGNMWNADEESRFGGRVPPEFVGLAIERHTQVWGSPPPEYQINTLGQPVKKPRASSGQPANGGAPTKTAANELPPGSASELHSMYFGQDEQRLAPGPGAA